MDEITYPFPNWLSLLLTSNDAQIKQDILLKLERHHGRGLLQLGIVNFSVKFSISQM